MAANVSPLPPSAQDLLTERAGFDGVFVAAIAYGALFMLYVQLLQVLSSRPQRGRLFWAIAVYSTMLYLSATLSIGGMLKFTEIAYIDERDYQPGGPVGYRRDFASNGTNEMSRVCTIIVPWLGDILMLYRLMVLWNFRWWLLVVPGPLYIARVSLSIPMLISETRPNDTFWASKFDTYSTAFYALCVSFNGLVTILIAVRLIMMRKRVTSILGMLGASFYTSPVTTFVESGAFFSLWSLTYVLTKTQNSYTQAIFLQPYVHIQSITRMLIVLRMAQNRAWSSDLVTATTGGNLDWQVASTHSIPLYEIPAASPEKRHLPHKFQEGV
ncbi:hypothetical protein BD779DRAFT_927297 [Infundibulicybe gibba]|nr:hypothetical protein BD779DRAFT_927297 [Infundibulicybe gibba]